VRGVKSLWEAAIVQRVESRVLGAYGLWQRRWRAGDSTQSKGTVRQGCARHLPALGARR
jgi:hypothetical protein